MISYTKLLDLLTKNGYTSYRIKKESIIGQGTLTSLKASTGGLDAKTLNKLCKLLDCQPGDLMEYVADEPPEA